VKTPDWKKIFPGKEICEVVNIEGGNANDIWQVETDDGCYIIKITRTTPDHQQSFWYGLYTTFGLDLRAALPYRKELVEFINQHSQLQIPKVMHVDTSRQLISKPYIITEYLRGEPVVLEEAADSSTLVYQMGEHLGRLHKARMETWGCFPQEPHLEPEQWKRRLPGVLSKLARRWEQNREAIDKQVEEIKPRIDQLPEPARFSLILPDLRPDQFTQQDGRLLALVDVESHVVGPRELDWIALEYSLRPEDVPHFIAGYEKHLAAPRLADVRQVYRFLYFLTNILGWTGLTAWMNAPALFD
jgi:aminoglycoside phosphotransferase (APT) family kinase protein